MIGRVLAAVKVAWKIKEVKDVIGRLRDTIASVNSLVSAYERAQADGRLTPDEVERLMAQLGQVARDGMRLKDEVDDLLPT